MEIKFRTYFWNKNAKKPTIVGSDIITLTDEELCDIVKAKYESEELSVPTYISIDELEVETDIDTVTH